MCEGEQRREERSGKGERRRGGQKPKQRSVNRASVEHQRSLNDGWFHSSHTLLFSHAYFLLDALISEVKKGWVENNTFENGKMNKA